jgi:hypothetical protein
MNRLIRQAVDDCFHGTVHSGAGQRSRSRKALGLWALSSNRQGALDRNCPVNLDGLTVTLY